MRRRVWEGPDARRAERAVRFYSEPVDRPTLGGPAQLVYLKERTEDGRWVVTGYERWEVLAR